MMATFNGERHLREQIDSILAQQNVDITLRACDDQSSDDTYGILNDYAAKFPNVLVSRNVTNLGVGKNFMQMVYESHDSPYDYYAFSDQDDIWHPDKLSHAVAMLRSDDSPVLYYSDVRDFTESREWSELEAFRQIRNHPSTVFLRNWACGCTMVFNRALRDLLCIYEPQSFPRIHDAWVHVVAYCCGAVVADFDHALIRRRISGHNAVGELSDHHKSFSAAFSDAVNLTREATHDPTIVVCQLVEGFADLLRPDILPTINMLLAYRDSMVSRLRAATEFDFWLPTRRGRVIVRACFLLGRY